MDILFDIRLFLFLGSIVLFSLFFLEFLKRKNFIASWVTRKVLHIISVSTCSVAVFFVENPINLILVLIPADAILFYVVARGGFFDDDQERKSWGIPLFPIPLIIGLIIWGKSSIIWIPMLILGISDPIAAFVGKLFPKKFNLNFYFSKDLKTIAGSLAFMLSTFLIFLVLFCLGFLESNSSNQEIFVFIFSASIILSLVEAFGSKGWDNFWIPIIGMLLIANYLSVEKTLILENNTYFNVIVLVSSVVFYFLMRVSKFLSTSGVFAAILIGNMVLWNQDLRLIIPLFIFLVLGSLAGKLNKFHNSDEKSGKPRDSIQVFANGLIYAILCLFMKVDIPLFSEMGNQLFFQFLCFVSISICIADTFASEFGQKYGGIPYDILSFKKVPKGKSGGVSLIGILFSIIGSSIMLLTFKFLFPNELGEHPVLLLLGFLLSILGMFIDSIIGSLFQIRYLNLSDNSWYDTSQNGAENQMAPQKGYAWLSNDGVNIISNLTVILLAGILFYFMMPR
jgi:uncharacterized protein (TIGR00297 family)